MGRQLTVSRGAAGYPIDAMVWLLEDPEVHLLETRAFETLADFSSWLRGLPDVSVAWTDELQADTVLALTVAEILGAPDDPSLPNVLGGASASFAPPGRPPAEVDSSRPVFLATPPPAPGSGSTLDPGRPRGRRHRRSSSG
jgi:hypothetical protein